MTRQRTLRSSIAIFVLLNGISCFMAWPANADNDISDHQNNDAFRRMQLMAKKLQEEKSQLQAELEENSNKILEKETQNSALSRTAKDLETNLANNQQRYADLQSRLQASNTRLADMENALADTRSRFGDLSRLQQETAQKVLELESEKHALETGLRERENDVSTCTTKNANLYSYGLDLIKLFDKPSAYERALRTEPFTKLKRVELENIFQDYRDKLDDNNVAIPAGPGR